MSKESLPMTRLTAIPALLASATVLLALPAVPGWEPMGARLTCA